MIDNLPAEKKPGGQHAGGDSQWPVHRQKRRAEHQIIPIEDAAGGAASVVHPKGLEGAEKENADDVADTVESCQAHQKPQSQPASRVAEKDQGVSADPRQGHQCGTVVCLLDGSRAGGFAGRTAAAGKDLLTAQALHMRGEEPHHHGCHQQQPHNSQGREVERPLQIREKLLRCRQRIKEQCAERGGSGGKAPEGIASGFQRMCHWTASSRTGRCASSHWARSAYTVSRQSSKRISCRSWG